MTAVDVDALDKLREAATPGEWITEPNYRLEKGCRCLSCWEPIPDSWDISPIDGPDCPEHGCWHNISLGEADAAYIVAMHAALPDLLAEVRRGRALREEHDELRHRLKALVDEWDAMARNLHHIPVAEAYADVVIGLRAVLAAVDGGEQP